MSKTSEIKVVLFDIDRTITPRGPDASQTMFQTVFGIDLSENAIANAGKTELQIILEVLAVAHEIPVTAQVSIEDIQQRITQLESQLAQAFEMWGQETEKLLQRLGSGEYQPLPGIVELLSQLKKHPHIILGLLTGNSPWRSEAKLKTAGVDHFFRNQRGLLQGAFGDKARKREHLIAIACAQFNVSPQQLFLIDDSEIGAQMTARNQIPSIMVATGDASVAALLAAGAHPDRTFSSFGQNRWQQALEIILAP